MKIKGLIDEDFTNYKVASLFIIFPYCSFKCEKECGIKCCQNSSVAKLPIIEISAEELVERYLNNNITRSIVFGGLEPFDSWNDIIDFISKLRIKTDDDIIIYTGYREDEIWDKLELLKNYKNIIIKFGRYVPNQKNKYDPLLGVTLASDNQYAKKIS